MTSTTSQKAPYRVGNWLPSDAETLKSWLRKTAAEAAQEQKPFLPVILDFQRLIEDDAEIFMLFSQMFEQVPHKPPYNNDPTGKPEVRSYQHMLELMNHILTKAPEFNLTGLVGFPINAILDWAMGTQAGFAAFVNPKVNAALKNILCEWGVFLQSSDSQAVLNTDKTSGWFGADAMKAMPGFDSTFICDPAAPYHGFGSWDDFFTRRFRPGQRPVADPQNTKVIANACESAPYRISPDVKASDSFWIKGQPYSLKHMFGGDDLYQDFVGGTVYQAFLSALSYHRWHSPIDGTIVKARVIEGTYYAEAQSEGYDPSGPNDSQGYITELAARAQIFIEATDPAIGLICVMPVGMAEVSTCQVTVYEGQQVKKGQEIGMFHFGGSTHCVFFKPGVKLAFDMHGQTPGLNSSNIPVCSRIATVL